MPKPPSGPTLAYAPDSGGVSAVQQKPSADEKKRAQLIDHMVRGNNPPIDAAQRSEIDSAMRAVSTKELEHLDQVGTRIWQGHDLPPEYAAGGVGAPRLSTPAQWAKGLKVLQLNPTMKVTASQIRHELGHAKDDVLSDPKGLKPILDYPTQDQRVKKYEEASTLASERDDLKFSTTTVKDGKASKAKLSIGEMYDAYKARTKGYPKDDFFHSPTQNPWYGRSDAAEFFGEAFSVFHGGDERMKARLLEQAPEVFYLLQADADANGLPHSKVADLKQVKPLYDDLPDE
jgi:hypothetical protein